MSRQPQSFTLQQALDGAAGELTVTKRIALALGVIEIFKEHFQLKETIHNDLSPESFSLTIDPEQESVFWQLSPTDEKKPKDRPGYSAPETYKKAPFAQSANIYTLGVILLQILVNDTATKKNNTKKKNFKEQFDHIAGNIRTMGSGTIYKSNKIYQDYYQYYCSEAIKPHLSKMLLHETETAQRLTLDGLEEVKKCLKKMLSKEKKQNTTTTASLNESKQRPYPLSHLRLQTDTNEDTNGLSSQPSTSERVTGSTIKVKKEKKISVREVGDLTTSHNISHSDDNHLNATTIRNLSDNSTTTTTSYSIALPPPPQSQQSAAQSPQTNLVNPLDYKHSSTPLFSAAVLKQPPTGNKKEYYELQIQWFGKKYPFNLDIAKTETVMTTFENWPFPANQKQLIHDLVDYIIIRNHTRSIFLDSMARGRGGKMKAAGELLDLYLKSCMGIKTDLNTNPETPGSDNPAIPCLLTKNSQKAVDDSGSGLELLYFRIKKQFGHLKILSKEPENNLSKFGWD